MTEPLMTFDEWTRLLPESRAKINAYGKEYEAMQARLSNVEVFREELETSATQIEIKLDKLQQTAIAVADRLAQARRLIAAFVYPCAAMTPEQKAEWEKWQAMEKR